MFLDQQIVDTKRRKELELKTEKDKDERILERHRLERENEKHRNEKDNEVYKNEYIYKHIYTYM
jgi:hypothetical protein